MLKGVKLFAACLSLLCFVAVSPAFAQKATLVSPADNSTLGPLPTITWTNAGTDYYIYVGSTLGAIDYQKIYCGTDTSIKIPGLPGNSNRVYVRLWSRNTGNGKWYYNDYSFKGRGSALAYDASIITNPAPDGDLTGTVNFTFDNTTLGGASAVKYLYLGSSQGASNYAWLNVGTASSISFKVPDSWANGTVVYARLYSQFGKAQTFIDYDYAVANPAITSPANGATLTQPANFTWVDATSTLNLLQIGTTLGGSQIYSQYVDTDTAATVPGLPFNGSTVYVRLYCLIGGKWIKKDYSYIAATAAKSDLAAITSPADNSTIDNTTTSVTFVWDNATKTQATNYNLFVGTTVGSDNIYNSRDLGTVNTKTISTASFPHNSRVYVRLFTTIGKFRKYLDFSYKTK